ncbi:MAG: ferrochelatase [Acidimicrobiia bacterium]
MSIGVLFMAYGSPRTIEEVEPYYTDIRGGRKPSAEALEHLKERYLRIGGTSPLEEVTTRQAVATVDLLRREGLDATAYVGMKHWHPFISDAVQQMHSDEVEVAIGLVLAPHFSKMSIGGYEERVLKAKAEIGAGFDFAMVDFWYDDQKFIDFVAANLRDTLNDWSANEDQTRVFFTAHSLPERILASGDPYRDQLLDSSRLVAQVVGISNFEFAFQSASSTGEPWLGPDILDRLESFKAEGGKRAVVAPIGFTADHLEVLFDVDVECAEKCGEIGLEFRRIPSPNDDPRFVGALAGIVRRAL